MLNLFIYCAAVQAPHQNIRCFFFGLKEAFGYTPPILLWITKGAQDSICLMGALCKAL